MRKLSALLMAMLVAAGLSIAAAAPAQAAAPTCTSWSTYWASFGEGWLVVHVPSAGNQTGTVQCILKQGNRNDAVKVLQRALHYCEGHPEVAVDGDYGPITRAAVLDIQHFANSDFGAGLAEDGEYGPQTMGWIQFTDWYWPQNTRSQWCDSSPV
jgi:peptidoglycan hydrolase-like protein with peptidoglycan-binding domain